MKILMQKENNTHDLGEKKRTAFRELPNFGTTYILHLEDCTVAVSHDSMWEIEHGLCACTER